MDSGNNHLCKRMKKMTEVCFGSRHTFANTEGYGLDCRKGLITIRDILRLYKHLRINWKRAILVERGTRDTPGTQAKEIESAYEELENHIRPYLGCSYIGFWMRWRTGETEGTAHESAGWQKASGEESNLEAHHAFKALERGALLR